MNSAAFWEARHVMSDVYALSHSDPEEVIRTHNLYDRIKPGASVLDIGIGDGRMSTWLCNAGCIVTSVDVAPSALLKADMRSTRCLVGEMEALGPFDLALAHLVVQHLAGDELLATFRRVRLADGGILSVQTLNDCIANHGLPMYPRHGGALSDTLASLGFKSIKQFLAADGFVGEPEEYWSWTVVWFSR